MHESVEEFTTLSYCQPKCKYNKVTCKHKNTTNSQNEGKGAEKGNKRNEKWKASRNGIQLLSLNTQHYVYGLRLLSQNRKYQIKQHRKEKKRVLFRKIKYLMESHWFLSDRIHVPKYHSASNIFSHDSGKIDTNWL